MSEQTTEKETTDPFKPYKGRFKTYPSIPRQGRDKDDIFKELSVMADEENEKVENRPGIGYLLSCRGRAPSISEQDIYPVFP